MREEREWRRRQRIQEIGKRETEGGREERERIQEIGKRENKGEKEISKCSKRVLRACDQSYAKLARILPQQGQPPTKIHPIQ